MFLFLVILNHTSDLAIAARSNFKLYLVGNYSRVKPGSLAQLQDLSRVQPTASRLTEIAVCVRLNVYESTPMNDKPMQKPNSQTDLAIPKDKLVLLPFYHELENEVKQPDRVRLQTDYFWRKWAPKLGPTLTVLVITLRSYCYYNKLTKERRDWCYPEQKTLADNIGVSVDTVQRELKKLIARYFVTREPRYRYDDRLKRPVRTADTYHIAMDDPLTPEDLQEVANMAKNRLENGNPDGKPQTAAYPNKPVDKSPGKPQSAVHIATADRRSRISTSKNDLRTLSKDIHRPLSDEQQALVEEILSVCGDQHSRKFYELTVKILPREGIWSALSQVRDADRSGQVKVSKAAYFTSLVNSHLKTRQLN